MSFQIINHIIAQYDFNLEWAGKLVEDLSEEQMTSSPYPGFENHPAFTLGHLATGSALLIEDLGETYRVPPGWGELFMRKGPGDPRLPERNVAIYPDKKSLVLELTRQHNLVKALLVDAGEEKFKSPIQWRYDRYFPTVLDLVIFMCISHEAMHLGQLSAWRRAMGLGSALGKL